MLMRLSVLCVSLLLPSGLSLLNPGRALQHRSHARAALTTLHAAKTPPKRRRPSRRRGRAAQHATKVPSFAGRLQRARTVDQTLALLAQAETSAHTIAAFQHLALRALWRTTTEATEAERYRRDARLLAAMASLTDGTTLTATERCYVLWSLAMIYPTSSHAATTAAATRLSSTCDEASRMHEIEPHVAGMGVWGCESLGVPVPASLSIQAQQLPYHLYPRLLSSVLDDAAASVQSLVTELPIATDEIASGSAKPSVARVTEDRGTCWLSDEELPFEYSGKRMAPSGRVTQFGHVACIRDSIGTSLGRHYCSVLVNHYPDGGSGMRFHSDPGQGEQGGWGNSTAVVSVGASRLFTFRRSDDPHVRATFAVRHGDVLHMHSDCQEAWQHSVVREQPGGREASPHAQHARPSTDDAARVSFVFKRSWAAERAAVGIEAPVEYIDALRWLRHAAQMERWPETSPGRARVMRGCGGSTSGLRGRALTFSRPQSDERPMRANAIFPELTHALFALEQTIGPEGRPPSNLCTVSVDAELIPHAMPATRDDEPAMMVSL